MNENISNCELDLPYPPIKTEGKNLYFASLLTNDYAGAVSEMSAVTKYSFQHAVTTDRRTAEIMKCISLVEMRHLGFLSEIIRDFGGNPRIAVQSGCSTVFWSARYIAYDTDPRTYLRGNLSDERAAIASYRSRISQIDDRFVGKLLARIILDEENHIRIFSLLLEELF